MAASHPIVVFTPSGLTGSVESGTTVLDAARRLGADLDTVCGGRGICGRCQVVPGVGSFAKWGIDATAEALERAGPARARLPREPAAARRTTPRLLGADLR